MKDTARISEMVLLDIVYERIISEIEKVNSHGITDGQMGIVLFLYNYARLKKCEEIKEKADTAIDSIWESVHSTELPLSFFNGQSGIVWALSELGRNSFLEIDDTLNSYMESVDYQIFRVQKTKIPVLIDIESGLFTSGIYLLSRCNLPDSILLKEYRWHEKAVYLIEDCERIIFRKTCYNNIFLPKPTLSLLNSILYFLINAHMHKLYPHKTSILIKELCLQIEQLMKQSAIQDNITSLCLLSQINDNETFRDFIDISSVSGYISKSIIQFDNALTVLAQSGFYTIFYDNRCIFKETYLHICQLYPLFFQYLSNEIVRKDIALKNLLGIGNGLLTMLN